VSLYVVKVVSLTLETSLGFMSTTVSPQVIEHNITLLMYSSQKALLQTNRKIQNMNIEKIQK